MDDFIYECLGHLASDAPAGPGLTAVGAIITVLAWGEGYQQSYDLSSDDFSVLHDNC